MSLPSSISAFVSPAAISKVSRLFNGSVQDALHELLQNARRAGASIVDIHVEAVDGHRYLCVHDDGPGIDDPAIILSLGQSGWDDTTMQREDPAGMGIFSLAGRAVEIRSWSQRHRTGWRAIVSTDAWEGSAPVAIEPFSPYSGTQIRVLMPTSWEVGLVGAIRSAALHYPLTVRFDGEAVPSRPWLERARYVETWGGCRIGVYIDDQPHWREKPRINFHGLTVPCEMPSVTEQSRKHWSVLIDIGDAPQLQLVLPARKEMVENEALDTLRTAALGAIYRAIAAEDGHQLGYTEWSAGRALGVALRPAFPRLESWAPARLDRQLDHRKTEILDAANTIIMCDCEPSHGQSLALALEAEPWAEGPLAQAEPASEGYDWYDAIPQVRRFDALLRRGKDETRINFDEAAPEPIFGQGAQVQLYGVYDSIMFRLLISTTDQEKSVSIIGHILIDYRTDHDWCLEAARIFLVHGHEPAIESLVDLVEASCFDPSDDSDADSWYTQHDRFLLDAEQMVVERLFNEDEGVLTRCRHLAAQRLQWLVPKGKRIILTISDGNIDAQLEALGNPPEPVAL